MKKIGILVCVCAALYIFFNFQTVRLVVNESLNTGSLKGVENCIAFSSSELVSPETTRNACISRLQKPLFNGELVNGRAGPRFRDGSVFLGGEIRNDTPTHITTWLRVYIGVFDDNGTRSEFSGETFTWIEPQSSEKLEVELEGADTDELKELKFCPHGDDESTFKSCMIWGVSQVRGIGL